MKNNSTNRSRSSLTWKLNIKLFFRLLGIFLTLNIALTLAAAAWLVIRSEQTVTSAAALLRQTGAPSAETENWLAPWGVSVSVSPARPAAANNVRQITISIPENVSAFFSSASESGLRYIEIPDFRNSSGTVRELWTLTEDITYNAVVETNRRFYKISLSLQTDLQLLIRIFILLFILELLMLLGNTFSTTLTIRKALRPIEELAVTAQRLNTEGGVFTPEQLEALAGKLDHINAAKLDTRISVDDTQDELKTLASAINGMLERINQAYRSQARFVSDASHELRTPISVIQGYANLLDRWGKDDPKTLDESITAIKEETANMKSMVEQLLFLARGDNNALVMQIEGFDLSELAMEVFRETQMIDEGHEYASSLTPVRVNADKGLIKQVLRVLIDNAIKYTPAGQSIHVSVPRIRIRTRPG